jgi:formimidoylglutamate deiminase
MTTLFAPTALLPEGWADNVLIEYDKDGWIIGVDTFKPEVPQDSVVEIVKGPLIPGMANVHSHAFQRAMAGLAERASAKKDNFWSWRETMYRFLSFLDPEDMGVLAAQAYVEMLKAGYTSVAEFHYVHHQKNGDPYEDRAMMSREIVRAAVDTGIGITHLPCLYAYSGFGEVAPQDGQKRFINKVPELLRIIEEVYGEFRSVPQVTVGMAHHSLRAVSPEMLREGTQGFRRLLPDAPIHIHAAEQMQEVESCMNWAGKRPVEWLLENGGVDKKWCFIHCTHVNDHEILNLAQAGVTVGLCPTTEANLGDGIFPLVAFNAAGGTFGIGSDSNITINMFDELRWLEYVQRLVFRERTMIRSADIPSVGGSVFDKALKGGAQAVGRKTGRIEVGSRADFLVLDDTLPFMAGKLRDHILDSAIFAANQNPVKDVMAGGRWVVRDRHHRREEEIFSRYFKMLKKISW